MDIQNIASIATIENKIAAELIEDEVVAAEIDHVHSIACLDDGVPHNGLHIHDIRADLRRDKCETAVCALHGEVVVPGSE